MSPINTWEKPAADSPRNRSLLISLSHQLRHHQTSKHPKSVDLSLSLCKLRAIVAVDRGAMACKLSATSSQWIGQQSFTQRNGSSSSTRLVSAPRRVSFPIQAKAYTDELVQTAVSHLRLDSLIDRYLISSLTGIGIFGLTDDSHIIY